MMMGASPFSPDFLREAIFHGQEFLERRSFKSPLEHFRLCRAALLRYLANGYSDELKKEVLNLSRYPFGEYYQPSIAALALLSKIFGIHHSPVVPMLLPSGAPFAMKKEARRDDCLLPLPIAWQLSQLWMELGRLESDFELIEKAHLAKKWVEKFAARAKLLFYPEKSFDSKETEDFVLSNQSAFAGDLHLGMAAFSASSIDACLSLSGWNSSLGGIRLDDVIICSFGPQSEPLSDTAGFGVAQARASGSVIITEKNRVELEGWTRCYGCKETWLYLKSSLDDHSVQLDVRFIEKSLYMVFYVKAEKCSPEGVCQSFLPGSLQRYRGIGESVLLNDRIRLACRGGADLQIIPLAGEGCFWNANFLIAFSSPSNSFLSFELSL